MSKVFEVTAPDGHVLEVTGPADATEEQALAQAQLLYKPQAAGERLPSGKAPTLGGRLKDTLYNALTGQMVPGADVGNEPTQIPGPLPGALDWLRHAFEGGVPGSAATAAMAPLSAEALKASPAGQVVTAAKNLVTKTPPKTAVEMFNKAANVPGGRQGVTVSRETGQTVTNPGNAVIRALQDQGVAPPNILKAAANAKPSEELQILAYGEKVKAGNLLEQHLAPSNKVITFDWPDTPKANAILKDSGLPVNEAGQVSAYPIEAHRLRAELGDKIQWSKNAIPTDANDAMKEAYFDINRKIESAVPNTAPLNKRWQEAELFSRAHAAELEKVIAQKKGLPMSATEAATAARNEALWQVFKKMAIGTGILGGTGAGLAEIYRRLE